MAYIYTKELEIIMIEEKKALYCREEVSPSYQIDKYDLYLSVGVGVIAGLCDIFLVGTPTTKNEERSLFTKWSDEQTNDFIKKFSKAQGWEPRDGNENNVKSAIGYLEKKFGVNYDHRHNTDVDNLFRMSTKDHHLKSLGHSPDIVGLFFSIVNQFTNTATFVSDGQLITINSHTNELEGSNFILKLFCGFINWFGHLISDIGGSSGAAQRGSGIAMPFYTLTQFLNFGKFNVGKDKQTIAEIANRAFREGYDFRHGVATAIPVLLTEIIIRFFWALRAYFQYNYSLKESLPKLNNNHSLRRMLLMGHGTLCLLDGLDAGVKSGGNTLVFIKNLNFIGWLRLSLLVFKEISVTFNINLNTYEEIEEVYQEFHSEIYEQLEWFKHSNFDEYQHEISQYNQTLKVLEQNLSAEELNHELQSLYKKMKIELPWEDDFNDFMSNQGTLYFKKKGY